MFESVERLLNSRNEQSPALAFARSIGFDVDTFSVHWSLRSEELNRAEGGVPRYQSHAAIDSTSADWFRVSVSDVPNGLDDRSRTSFGSKSRGFDQLGLGNCSPEELPVWFARAAKKLKVHWEVSLWHSNLRGAKRERALAWMRGDDPSAQVKEPRARTRRTRAGSR